MFVSGWSGSLKTLDTYSSVLDNISELNIDNVTIDAPINYITNTITTGTEVNPSAEYNEVTTADAITYSSQVDFTTQMGNDYSVSDAISTGEVVSPSATYSQLNESTAIETSAEVFVPSAELQEQPSQSTGSNDTPSIDTQVGSENLGDWLYNNGSTSSK